MRDYSNLSDHDFELLVAQLLSVEHGVRYEVFARGADRGVDLRATNEDGQLIVVQCKHYRKSSYSQLTTAVKHERKNLEKLARKPDEYHLVTTFDLTAGNKDKIVAELTPFVKTPDRIIGASELEVLLNRHPKVERSQTKLWLTGAAQLTYMVHAEIWSRSKRLLREVNKTLPRYVETGVFDKAWRKLSKQRALIISGPPGIGKSTLARMLLANAARLGFEPVEVSSDIEEANKVLDSESRQIFYYDDFLGSTFLQDRLTKNEDQRLVSFIRDCVDSPRTLFILTTREHILRQATSVYETLANAELDARKLTLQIDQYSELERARILYNHVWHAPDLDEDSRKDLAKPINYRRVLNHRYYNPRLIEYVTGLSSYHLSGADKSDYSNFILSILGDPSKIWRYAFSRQLDSNCKDVVICLALLGAQATTSALSDAFNSQVRTHNVEPQSYALHDSLRILNDTFTKRAGSQGAEIIVEFANPSVGDFAFSWLSGDENEARRSILGACYFEQLPIIESQVIDKMAGRARASLSNALLARIIELWKANPLRQPRTPRRLGIDIRRRLIFGFSVILKYGVRQDDPLYLHCAQEAEKWTQNFSPSASEVNIDIQLASMLDKFDLFDHDRVDDLRSGVRDSATSVEDWRALLDIYHEFGDHVHAEDRVLDLEKVEEWVGQQLEDVSVGSHHLEEVRDMADEFNIAYDVEEFETKISELEDAQAAEQAREDRESGINEQEDDEESDEITDDEKVDRIFDMMRSIE